MIPFADIGVPVLGALVSAFVVLRWGWVGAIAGFFVFWGFSYLRLELLYFLDPQRDAGVFDAAVIGIISPALGFVWCSAFLLARFIGQRFRSRWLRNAQHQLRNEPTA